MRNWMRQFVGLAFVMLALASTAVADWWSPKGFQLPECTAGVDGWATRDGWTLQFARNYGPNAYQWWDSADRVVNAYQSQVPTAGSIMVVRSQSGWGNGHVAWVESVYYTGSTYRLTVRDTNLNKWGWYGWTIPNTTAQVWQHTCELSYSSNGTSVTFVNGGPTVAISGFLSRSPVTAIGTASNLRAYSWPGWGWSSWALLSWSSASGATMYVVEVETLDSRTYTTTSRQTVLVGGTSAYVSLPGRYVLFRYRVQGSNGRATGSWSNFQYAYAY